MPTADQLYRAWVLRQQRRYLGLLSLGLALSVVLALSL